MAAQTTLVEVRLVEPAHNVELRADRHGHEHVVFAFPYRAEIVDAVRAIPGRRFDWDAKEWWAPQADSTAPYVKGVLERFPSLLVADDVRAWIAEAVTGWVGRVGAARLDGRGAFQLETISGELPDDLDWTERGGRAWVPFSQQAAEILLELRGARLDKRALRCAMRLQVGQEPAPATLSLVDSVGDPRFTLDVNWDPDTIPAFLPLPACEAHGRSLPLDPYLIEPLEHYLRTYGVEVGGAAQEQLERLRAEHDAAIGDVRRSRAHDAPPVAGRGAPRGRAAPLPARRRRLRRCRRGGPSSPTSRGSARPCRRSRRSRPTTRGRRSSSARPASSSTGSARPSAGSRTARWPWSPARPPSPPRADLTVVNYDIVHAHRVRLALRKPKALVLDESHYVKNPRAKRTQAVRRLADALPPDALRLALTGTPVMNHAEELIAQLRIIGRLEDFGSGARFARRFQGIGAEERIHWHLRRSCFVRRAKADVLPQLPAKRQVAVPVALDNDREYRLAEQDVIAWLREQPLDLRELDQKVAAALRAERLAQLNALRRLASRGKGGAALAWIEDFLASDEPLVVFAGHREMQDRLVERFPDALHILGRDAIAAREAAVQGFQAGESQLLDLRHARRRPGDHAHPRVERRVPRPRVDARDARPGRGPLPPDRPARRRHGVVPARRQDDRRDDDRADRAQAPRSSTRSPTAAARTDEAVLDGVIRALRDAEARPAPARRLLTAAAQSARLR